MIARLAATDVFDPFVITKNSQGLGDRLVDAAGTNFNRMFNLPWRSTQETLHVFRATLSIYHLRFFFAMRASLKSLVLTWVPCQFSGLISTMIKYRVKARWGRAI